MLFSKDQVTTKAIRIAMAMQVWLAAAPLANSQEGLRAELPLVSERFAEAYSDQSLDWWNHEVTQPQLPRDRWVAFDLDTVLLDTLAHSPKILGVSHRTSVAFEKIVQQDAVFDPMFLLDSRLGRTNDPVGNSLITGGPPRLVEESLSASAGVRRLGRTGTVIDLSQQIGLLDSNSQFFDPANQGNARLSLSLTKPLRAGSGRLYNERLVTQARISGRVSWQEMRADVEQRLYEVVRSYWHLYQRRCQLMQQDRLIARGNQIEQILLSRNHFDASRIEITKAQQRTARRVDQRLQLHTELVIEQARLAALVGSHQLQVSTGDLELIPIEAPFFPELKLETRDAILQGIENRPEVRLATAELESAALSIQVTRNELLPSLSAIVEASLAGLNGRNQIGTSFIDQFTETGPGISAGLQYEMPRGQRGSLSRHREAQHRYQQKHQELLEIIQVTQLQIETALIVFHQAVDQQQTKRQLLITAIAEEEILTKRWEIMAGDGGNVGTFLENLLDAQQRRTDAEQEWVTAQSEYLVSFVELQRAMGTLLVYEGVPHAGAGHHCGPSGALQVPSLGHQVPLPVSADAISAPEFNQQPSFEAELQP